MKKKMYKGHDPYTYHPEYPYDWDKWHVGKRIKWLRTHRLSYEEWIAQRPVYGAVYLNPNT